MNRKVGNPNIGVEGKNTRFKPGVSANPGGRPRRKIISEAYKAILEHEDLETFKPQTNAEHIALEMVKEARGGKAKVSAASELADRTEGKPRQSYEVKLSITDELAARIAKARKKLK